MRAWWGGLPKSERPAEAGWRYAGGALLRVMADSPAAATVAIRSRGEAAFDTIGCYAEEITDVVEQAADDSTLLVWSELPVDFGRTID